jgi:NADPH:quinone reductase-like Zn-dependent oxidoreductase
VILDTVGKTSFARVKRALTPKGRFVPLEFGLHEIWQSLTGALRGSKRVVIGVSSDTRDDLEYLADLLARGKVTPVIDSSYALDRIAEAHRKVESRHKTGAVVILVDRAATPHLAVA